MMNPMTKRLPREMKQDWVKYIIIFAFMVMMIGLISGFVVSDDSFMKIYNEGFVEQKIEDGHVSFKSELPDSIIDEIEDKADLTVYPYFYFEENINEDNKTIRVYSAERDINLISIHEGTLPTSDDEIALDRMFAQNNEISVGDTVTIKDTEFTVSALVAFPDYSCLFESNTDSMFDAINFCVGVISEDAFDDFKTTHFHYNYAWTYPETIDREDKETAKKRSDDLIDDMEDILTDYAEDLVDEATELVMSGDLAMDEVEDYVKDHAIEVEDYLPRYLNQAINFTGDDMGGDKAMVLFMDYLMTLILAFVFAVTISGTIASEAGVIGTLRATGYSRGSLVRHYMILPTLVSIFAAVVGNILAYTTFNDLFVDIYNNSYSFAKYEAYWNVDAFVMTTIIPIIIMMVVNFLMLETKLRLSPLRFLRHDLSRRSRKKAVRLNTKIPFLHRFRIRIIFQNISGYLVMMLGVFVAGALMIFGLMFAPLLENLKEIIIEDQIADYQYVLMEEAETKKDSAEKYALTSLETTFEGYVTDEISIFGIEEDSKYIDIDLKEGDLYISSSIAEKFRVGEGDVITLKDGYNVKKTYDFTVTGVYNYTAGMAFFMPYEDYIDFFDEDEGHFDGYFSDEELTDIDEDDIAMLITQEDLVKTSDQLIHSMGSMMGIFSGFGAVVFILMMFLLTKQIIEKNASSISMTKILGYTSGEVSGLYLAATGVVVVIALLLTIPVTNYGLKLAFDYYLYTMMSGYLPYIVDPSCFVKMFVTGIVCFVFVALIIMSQINRIPKSVALKDME